MMSSNWMKIVISLLGLVALSAVIWWGGPYAGYGEFYPFEDEFVRVSLIALAALIVFGIFFYRWYQERKRRKSLEQATLAQTVKIGDGEVLDKEMQKALATLKRSRIDVYDLPWYVIIGAPASGKSTILKGCSLHFPLAKQNEEMSRSSIGGTRYCKWWFTDRAVFIDTPGRYTTQDSDTEADAVSWQAFLDSIKKNRPLQPINGVMLTLNIETILEPDLNKRAQEIEALRDRLNELHMQLKVDFPVYVMLTKMDKIPGFSTYFGHLNEESRRAVWGTTFDNIDRTQDIVANFSAEFDALITRLTEDVHDRLQETPVSETRTQIFRFPERMNALKSEIGTVLSQIFEPTVYRNHGIVRGFYFTSGTQDGEQIDFTIKEMERIFGTPQSTSKHISGQERTYFIADLVTKVMFGEAALASLDVKAQRRSFIITAALYTGLATFTLGAALAWWVSYQRNNELVLRANDAVTKATAMYSPFLNETIIADMDLAKIEPILNHLRTLPAGYSEAHKSTPLLSRFGLSQWGRLSTSSEALYDKGLERLMHSRMMYRLQEQIRVNLSNPEGLYELLKVYLILGGRKALDSDLKNLIEDWMKRDWVSQEMYFGAANVRLREALAEHLSALLQNMSSTSNFRGIKADDELIKEAQKTLARMSLAERGHQILRVEAQSMAGKVDWSAARKGGQDAKLVFEGANGADLDTVRVPYFYTYDGFHNAFFARLRDVAFKIETEKWVLGEIVNEEVIVAQYQTLIPDLLNLYEGQYVFAWSKAIGALNLRKLLDNEPKYPNLSAISALTSPFRQMLESIRDETSLTRERQKKGTGADSKENINQAANTLKRAGQAQSVLQSFGVSTPNIVSGSRLSILENAVRSLENPDPTKKETIPGARIEEAFRPYFRALDGQAGQRPIDQVLNTFAEIQRNFQTLATDSSAASQVNNQLNNHIQTLKNAANLMPAPFDGHLQGAAKEFQGKIKGEIDSIVRQKLRSEVTTQCRQIIENRYPFFKSSDRDVSIADFGRLFAVGGIMDRFYTQNLVQRLDTSAPEWRFINVSDVGSLRQTTLNEFKRAIEIRDTFFPSGGNRPGFEIVVKPLDETEAKLEVNERSVISNKSAMPVSFTWPGAEGLGRSVISITKVTPSTGLSTWFTSAPPPEPVRIPGPDKRGPWSFFKLLDGGSLSRNQTMLVARFRVGGQQVSYEIGVGASKNPLTLPALREFRCPVE